MGYAQDAMAELHGDRIIDNAPPKVQEAYANDAANKRREFFDRDPAPTSTSQFAKDNQGREYLKPTVLMEVQRELSQARATHAPMNSHHEGYAVILEELDELWEVCKQNTHPRGSQIHTGVTVEMLRA